MHLRFPLLILIFTLLAGCTLAPIYTRPAAPVTSVWPSGSAYLSETAGKDVANLKWQEFIQDEKLRNVIQLALANSRDLRIAALNVERAQALYGIQRAELYPALSVVGSGIKERVPADLSSNGSAITSERYSVDLGIVSWEIDFFGRIRSLEDRALEEFFSSDQAYRSTQILLVSAVSNAWLNLAADRESLKLVESTFATQEYVYKLIKKRYDVGVASELDLRRAQTQMDAAKGDIARYIQITAQDENALRLLVGSEIPQELLPAGLTGVKVPANVSPGLSSEVLLRRPDVLAAEHQLKAANANIGAARAAFFPRISLTSTVVTASAELSGLFKSGQGTWTFAPLLTMPIFDARTWSAYKTTKVEKEIFVTQYEKAIQTAFREVADALAVRGTINQQVAAQQSLVDAASVTYRLSNSRYTKGIDGYLSVLDAQRSLYSAQQTLISLELARIANSVTLYKVLGGGV
jgi:multidrug efflux system outer membrane protein